MAWALILLILMILGMVAFVAMARKGAVERASDATEQMDADSRSLFSPIRRLTTEIEELAAKQDSTAGRVVGEEAAREARRIREQCAQALVARAELKKAGRGRGMTLGQIEDLGHQVEAATTEGEKEAFRSAQDAYKRQLGHIEQAESALGRIDVSVKAAEAVLAEMKTRLLVASSSEKAELAGEEDLRETISRMRTLSVSYDEAEQALREL